MIRATIALPARPYLSVDADLFASDVDVDVVAVERAVNGERPEVMTRAERCGAAMVLDAAGGLTDTQIGERVGSATETVRKWRVNGWDVAGTKPAPSVVREPAKCGTPRGYKAHHHRGEIPCGRCKGANAAIDRRRGMGPESSEVAA